ncbi:hypothetical protein SAICODRAFT_22479 [Saitoella complicata NRRL Y-17804]|uniref:Uncharacterized protein n=1 Tax=Saitoella complicata (strain BCRC 22490 / CBS 7301 / JCM 7358 / NBRC 10748 / NRRL Y-17804) TaxID=698492 RepID=A0A0E9NHW8_SAICN|nr:uncharacterized protein SAICODRAFT_22479 [Saitoella complicata NRRL Y-17804]ODQ56052.1 hypothetical protein SAICODRAFT_22479 [Saitoella complicata NRRL Y-17804]GAO49398.1 hypothetical protein G7K_3548-t1 [Saitoella complicata NRRL Y-17804]
MSCINPCFTFKGRARRSSKKQASPPTTEDLLVAFPFTTYLPQRASYDSQERDEFEEVSVYNVASDQVFLSAHTDERSPLAPPICAYTSGSTLSNNDSTSSFSLRLNMVGEASALSNVTLNSPMSVSVTSQSASVYSSFSTLPGTLTSATTPGQGSDSALLSSSQSARTLAVDSCSSANHSPVTTVIHNFKTFLAKTFPDQDRGIRNTPRAASGASMRSILSFRTMKSGAGSVRSMTDIRTRSMLRALKGKMDKQ